MEGIVPINRERFRVRCVERIRDALNAFYTNRESWLSHTSFSFIKKIVQFSITELDLNFNIKENLTPRQIILYGLDELETENTPS